MKKKKLKVDEETWQRTMELRSSAKSKLEQIKLLARNVVMK